MANPIGARHCKSCGLVLGIECPSCGKLTEAVTPHCAECGANIEKVRREKEEAEIARQNQIRQNKIDDLNSIIRKEQQTIQDLDEMRHRVIILPKDVVRLAGFSLGTKLMLGIAAFGAWMIIQGGDYLFGGSSSMSSDSRLGAAAFFIGTGLFVIAYVFLALKLDSRKKIPRRIAEHDQRIIHMQQEVKQLQSAWIQSDRQNRTSPDA